MLETLQKRWNDLSDSPASANSNFDEQPNFGISKQESVIALAAAMVATVLARRAIQAGWRTTLNREPPKNPASPSVDWREALIWGAASGAVLGMVRIVTRRGTSAVYRSWKA